jgi:hypothetical protein
MADAIDLLTGQIMETWENGARSANAEKASKRLAPCFATPLQVIPARGTATLAKLVARPQSIEALQDLLSTPQDGGLLAAPVRVTGSGRGANWVACLVAPKRTPRDGCVVITVALGGHLVRLVPEKDFVKYWGDPEEL